jgi:ribonuclease G
MMTTRPMRPMRRRPMPRRPTSRRAGDAAAGRAPVPPIQDLIKKGQDLIVQVTKEPISTKGPRVTAQVSLAGRFLVYMPFASKVGVSRKIGEGHPRQAARDGAGGAAQGLGRGDRAHGQRGCHAGDLPARADDAASRQWKRIKKKQALRARPPVLHRETSLTRGIIRDVFSAKVDSLTVDSKQVHHEIVEYLKGDRAGAGRPGPLYEDKVPLFDQADIETEIRDLFKRRCDLPSRRVPDHRADRGAGLDRRQLRPLHGQEGSREDGPEDEPRGGARDRAAAPAARRGRHHRLRLHRHGDEGEPRQGAAGAAHAPRRDRARTKAFAVSDLGLIEMTRQRVRQSHLQSMTDGLPDLQRHGPGVHARDHRAPHGALGPPLWPGGARDSCVVKLHPDVALYVLEQEKD